MTEPGRPNRRIIHLDMDAFYASVEVLDDPALKGRPVIVGGRNWRGVVSAASYEARAFGVHSAQPIATAMKLCPQGVYLRPRLERYKEISDQILEIFRTYTPLVEPLSLDEAFLDVTDSVRLFGDPVDIARTIKQRVRAEVGLTVSAGVAPAKFLAKIASDLEKPDGLTVVTADRVREFLEPLPIDRLWGVGRTTRQALALIGVETMGDLARLSPDLLARKFGKHGLHLHRLSQGLDDRAVEPDQTVKSIGAEETFPKDLTAPDAARREILWLVTRAGRRMRRHAFLCRTVSLKVKYADFTQVTRAETLPHPTDQGRVIYQALVRLMDKTAVGQHPVRLLGVSLSQLVIPHEDKQASLFQVQGEEQKGRELDQAMDRISQKFGPRAILPATLLEEE
ncbi:MAG: DNA polymerase IV [Proteobacteria bacterium]|nr:DNA polymerase IV [Pseudomonadota bacterium]